MSNLTGSWRNGDAVLQFGDGTLRIGGRTFVQQLGDGAFLLFPVDAQMLIPYRVEGDTLVLDIDGRCSAWQRTEAQT